MISKREIEKIKNDIRLYENEIGALEKVKECSDVGPFAAKYIDRNITVIKRHIFELQAEVDLHERDEKC